MKAAQQSVSCCPISHHDTDKSSTTKHQLQIKLHNRNTTGSIIGPSTLHTVGSQDKNDPKPETLNPKPNTPHPKPYTLNPKPENR